MTLAQRHRPRCLAICLITAAVHCTLVGRACAEPPGPEPPNLIRNSRFPLGPQTGWTLDRDSSDRDVVVIAPDPEVRGPSGTGALRLATKETAVLWTEPFAVPTGSDRHCASMFVRGEGKLAVCVVADLQTIAQTVIVLKNDWQRAQVAFDPVPSATTYGIRLEFSSTFWLDGLQVNRGSEATPYVSQGACEVALGLPESDASAARVQFDDEPPGVLYAVTGEAAGATVKARVVDVYGAARDLPPAAIGPRMTTGMIDYLAGSTAELGPFRIEAWVEDDQGDRVSPHNELVVYRLRRPRYWGRDAPGSHFGVHTTSTTRHILMAKAIGANWTRLHDAGLEYIGWYYLEPERGKWKFRDREIERYRRYGVKILAELGTAPPWASYMTEPHNGYFDQYYQPRDLADYERYVSTVAKRYRGVIDAWDVWNEPWQSRWWAVAWDSEHRASEGYVTSENAPADFAALTTAAYRAVKSVDPAATVCGFNSTTSGASEGICGGTEWTRGVLDAGGLDACDAIGYHHYTASVDGFPGDSVQQGLWAAVGPVRDRLGSVPKPIWMTEGSPVMGTGEGMYHYTLPYEPGENVLDTSDRLVRYLVSLLANGVEKVFLYSVHCHSYFKDGSGNFRALVTEEGYLHPSAAAHANVAWLLDDARFVRRMELPDSAYAYLFESDDRRVAVLIGGPEHPESDIPRTAGAQVLDMFGNPVSPDAKLGRYPVFIVTPVADGTHAEGRLTPLESATLRRVNKERVARGLRPLKPVADMQAIARAHSLDMSVRGYFAHNDPDGVTPMQRAARAGVRWAFFGENIATTSKRAGRSDEELASWAVDDWMKSEGHRKNILDPEYTETGLGVYEAENGEILFTQDFLRRG